MLDIASQRALIGLIVKIYLVPRVLRLINKVNAALLTVILNYVLTCMRYGSRWRIPNRAAEQAIDLTILRWCHERLSDNQIKHLRADYTRHLRCFAWWPFWV